MRLSEAIRLGSLAIPNPRGGDTRYCAIGMGLEAIGKRDMTEVYNDFCCGDNYRANYDALAAAWPWILLSNHGMMDFKSTLYCTFDSRVMTGKMTLEALCDQVRAWEDELEAKGVNVEQVSLAAELTEPVSQAAEHTEKVLEKIGE